MDSWAQYEIRALLCHSVQCVIVVHWQQFAGVCVFLQLSVVLFGFVWVCVGAQVTTTAAVYQWCYKRLISYLIIGFIQIDNDYYEEIFGLQFWFFKRYFVYNNSIVHRDWSLETVYPSSGDVVTWIYFYIALLLYHER